MAFNINDMRAQLTGGGARPTLFQVQITNPANNSADIKVPFMVKAASLPADNLGNIEVGYFGRKIKLAGDRTFDEWQVTVINDEDFAVRDAIEHWMSAINLHQQNQNSFGTSSPSAYKSQGKIIQYGKDGSVVREYQFNGMFPTNVSEITTDWDSNDTIEEFSVTFQYDWWSITGGKTGNAGGE